MTKKVTDKDIRELVVAYTQLPKKYREQAKVFLFYLQCVAFQGNPVGHDADVKKISLSKVKALFASKQAAEVSKKITGDFDFSEATDMGKTCVVSAGGFKEKVMGE